MVALYPPPLLLHDIRKLFGLKTGAWHHCQASFELGSVMRLQLLSRYAQGKAGLCADSSFKNHRSWKMKPSWKILQALGAAEIGCQANLTGPLYLEFCFFLMKADDLVKLCPTLSFCQLLADTWSPVSSYGNPRIIPQPRAPHERSALDNALIRRNAKLLLRWGVFINC